MLKHSLSSVTAIPWQMLPHQYKNNAYSVLIYCCCIVNYFSMTFWFLDKYWNTTVQILMVLTKAQFFTLILKKMCIKYIKYLSCVIYSALWQIVLNDCFEYTSLKNCISDSYHSLRVMWNWRKCCSKQEWFFKTISCSNVKVWFLIHFCETKKMFGSVLMCGRCMPCENCWNLLGRK